jgi:hypothetical protein
MTLYENIKLQLNDLKTELKIPQDVSLSFKCGFCSYNMFNIIKTFLYHIIVKTNDIDNEYIKIQNGEILSLRNTNDIISDQLKNVPNDYLIKCNNNSNLLTKHYKYIYVLTIENMCKILNLIRELSYIIPFINVKLISTNSCNDNVYKDCNNKTFDISIEMFCLLHLFNTILVYPNNTQYFDKYNIDQLTFPDFDNNILSNPYILSNDSLNKLLKIFPLNTFHSINMKALPTIELEPIELYNDRFNLNYNTNDQILYLKISDMFNLYKTNYYLNTNWDCLYYNISQEQNVNNKLDIEQFFSESIHIKKHKLFNEKVKNLYYMIYKIYIHKITICNKYKCTSTSCNKITDSETNKFDKILYNILINDSNDNQKTNKKINNKNKIMELVFNISPHDLIEIFSFKL